MRKIYFLITLVYSSLMFSQETAEENAKMAFEFVMAGENADHLINKAIELDKDYSFTYVCRGLQKQYLDKNIDEAIIDFDLAIKLKDSSGYALYYKALIFFDRSQKEYACELIEQCKKMNLPLANTIDVCD